MGYEIGSINYRITADAKQALVEMQKVVAAFKAGDLTAKQYAAAVAGVAAQYNGFEAKSRGAVANIGRLRGSFTALATSMLGIRGPLGSVVSTLGMLALGSGVATGIVAGIAAIAFAYQKLTEKTKEAQAAAKAHAKAIYDAWTQLEPVRRSSLEQRRTQLQAQIGTLTRPGVLADIPGASAVLTPETAQALRQARRELAVVENELAGLNREGQRSAEKFAAAAAAYEATADGINQMRAAAVQAINDFSRFNPWQASILPTDQGGMNRGDALQRAHAMEQRLRQQGEALREKLTAPWKDKAAKEEMSEIGEVWARSILTSMVRAFRDGNVGKAFANVLGTILEQVIVTAILKGLRGAAGGGGFFGWLGKVLFMHEGGVVPGGQGQEKLAVLRAGETVMPTQGGSGVLQVSVPQLSGPALVTNAEWQRIWRDTAREATRQGFRMAVV